MIVRQCEEHDGQVLAEWLKSVPWPYPPVDNALSQLGFICEEDREPIAAAWLYLTDSGLAFFDWPVTNPDFPQTVTTLAIEALVQHLKILCENTEPKVTCLIHYTKNEALAQTLKNQGFKAKKGFVQMTFIVGGFDEGKTH